MTVSVYRMHVAVVYGALKLMHESQGKIIPTRGYNRKKGLAHATEITGKKYKTKDIEKAMHDLKMVLDYGPAEMTSHLFH